MGVKFSDNLKGIKNEDAYLVLSYTLSVPVITINTYENMYDNGNKNLFHRHITKNLSPEFNDDEITCIIKYNDTFNNSQYEVSFSFDRNSSSAYENFKKEFQTYLQYDYQTLYYDNGDIKYAGET